jgi:hypothetical protein
MPTARAPSVRNKVIEIAVGVTANWTSAKASEGEFEMKIPRCNRTPGGLPGGDPTDTCTRYMKLGRYFGRL